MKSGHYSDAKTYLGEMARLQLEAPQPVVRRERKAKGRKGHKTTDFMIIYWVDASTSIHWSTLTTEKWEMEIRVNSSEELKLRQDTDIER